MIDCEIADRGVYFGTWLEGYIKAEVLGSEREVLCAWSHKRHPRQCRVLSQDHEICPVHGVGRQENDEEEGNSRAEGGFESLLTVNCETHVQTVLIEGTKTVSATLPQALLGLAPLVSSSRSSSELCVLVTNRNFLLRLLVG